MLIVDAFVAESLDLTDGASELWVSLLDLFYREVEVVLVGGVFEFRGDCN
jgi:hypothetical protein